MDFFFFIKKTNYDGGNVVFDYFDKHRITAVLKAKTYIIISFAASLRGGAGILVI